MKKSIEYVLQGNCRAGWMDIQSSKGKADASLALEQYRLHSPDGQYRIIRRIELEEGESYFNPLYWDSKNSGGNQ